MIDYYEVLVVSRIASRDEIHKAFLRLSAHLSARRDNEPDAEKRLAQINEAHDVLYDPARRAAYDSEVWKSPS